VRLADRGFQFLPPDQKLVTQQVKGADGVGMAAPESESVGSAKNVYIVSGDGIHWTRAPTPPGATAPEI